MYQAGDLIVYENAGVCQVMDLTASENCPALSCMPKGRLYYILHPLFGGGTIYTPADPPKAFMRPVISRREAEALISLIPKLKADPYYTQNLQDLREHYKAAASSHSCKDLIQLTMSVYKKKGDAIARGKRVGQVDQKYMRQAENQLFGELAVALGIDREAVPDYIDQRLKEGPAELPAEAPDKASIS